MQHDPGCKPVRHSFYKSRQIPFLYPKQAAAVCEQGRVRDIPVSKNRNRLILMKNLDISVFLPGGQGHTPEVFQPYGQHESVFMKHSNNIPRGSKNDLLRKRAEAVCI